MAVGSDQLLEHTAPRLRRARPRLFLWAAAIALLVVLVGFARTYYLKYFFDTRSLTSLVHLHGVVMTLWFGMLVAQVWLVSSGNVRKHRRLGIFGAAVAVLVIVVGTATAIESARNGNTPGPPPLVFLAVPLGDMVLFSVLVALGLAYRDRGDFHKRFMICASFGIVGAAVARIAFVREGGILAIFGAADLILLAFVAADTWSNRRLHPAFAIGFAMVVLSQVARLALAGTATWMQFATWLTS